MDQLWAAVIGAVVGGLTGGFFTLRGARKQVEVAQKQVDVAQRQVDVAQRAMKQNQDLVELQLEQAKSQAHQARTWEIASVVSTIQSEILNSSTPNTLKSDEDVQRLQVDWNRTNRQLHILGYNAIAQEFTSTLRPYLDSLQGFINDRISRTELDQQRREARNRVEDTMNRLTRV
jgi:hypothetical protein